MVVKWLRRAAAVTRKRVRLALELASGRPPTALQKRRRLMETGRRKRAVPAPAPVIELSARNSGQREAFRQPSLLILQLAHIGDFVLSLRAAQTIRTGFPGSRVTLVCASWNIQWARETGLFDEVVAFDFFPRLNKDWAGPPQNAYERFESLALGAFDIAVDLRHDADTRPCLYRVRAKVRAGFAAAIETGYLPLDLMLPQVELLPLSDGREYSQHAELRLELLANAVVSAYAEAKTHPISLIAGKSAERAGRAFAILALSAGDPIRRWPQERFVELGRRLIETYDFDILVVGGSPEQPLVEEIVASLPQKRAASSIDGSLTDLAAKVAQASLFVGLGSGVTHLAATLGVPTVCVLSGVSPLDVWRPVGPRVVNLTGETPCSPCGLKREEECPFGVTCLTSIEPDRVLASVQDLLRSAPRASGLAYEEAPAQGSKIYG